MYEMQPAPSPNQNPKEFYEYLPKQKFPPFYSNPIELYDEIPYAALNYKSGQAKYFTSICSLLKSHLLKGS